MPLTTAVLNAGTAKTFMARIRGANGRPITRASISTITYAVKDRTNDSTVSTGSLTVADVVYDDLQQNDPRWDLDSEAHPGKGGYWGYNFLVTLASTLFPGLDDAADEETEEDIRYRVDFKFTDASGNIWVTSFEFVARRVYV